MFWMRAKTAVGSVAGDSDCMGILLGPAGRVEPTGHRAPSSPHRWQIVHRSMVAPVINVTPDD
jgi:hypothetical protein